MSLRLLALAAAAAAAASGASAQSLAPQAVYTDNCAACHQPTGKGVKGAFPALAGDPFVLAPPPQVIAVVLNGRGGMPAFKDELSDAQLAAAITYVRTAWGNKAKPVSSADVAKVRLAVRAAPKAKSLQAH